MERLEIPNIFEVHPNELRREKHPPTLDFKKIRKVEWEKNGGLLTFYEDSYYPLRGFMFDDIVEAVNVPKGVILMLARIVLKAPYILIFPSVRKTLLEQFVKVGGRPLEVFRVKPEGYSKSVQELHKKAWDYVEWVTLRDLLQEAITICAKILEWDTAYRYRVQDWFGVLDKDAFLKNPRKEIKRAFEVCAQREGTEVKTGTTSPEKWRLIGRALGLVLLYPPLKHHAKEFVKTLDLERIRLDEIDSYHLDTEGYKFGI